MIMGKLKTIVDILFIIVIIIGLIVIIQYKTADIQAHDAYEINLSTYQLDLDIYHIELDRYDQGVIYHALQVKNLDGTETSDYASAINTNGEILKSHGEQLQNENIRLDIRYREICEEKKNVDSLSLINSIREIVT